LRALANLILGAKPVFHLVPVYTSALEIQLVRADANLLFTETIVTGDF
jgi:hypothetical protein